MPRELFRQISLSVAIDRVGRLHFTMCAVFWRWFLLDFGALGLRNYLHSLLTAKFNKHYFTDQITFFGSSHKLSIQQKSVPFNNGSWCTQPCCRAGPQIYKGDPRPRISPCVMVSSAMGLKLGAFGFLPTTRKNNRETNASTIFMLRAVFHTQTAVDASDTCTRWTTVIFTGKTWLLQIWAPGREQNGAGSGISLVYLWAGLHFLFNTEYLQELSLWWHTYVAVGIS